MRRYATSLVACATVAVLAGTSMGQNLCWDNDLEPNGVNGRATSPPGFPDIRVSDDFTVPDGTEWIVADFHKTNIEDATWNIGDGSHEVTIYADAGGCPGARLNQQVVGNVQREFQGFQLFDRDVYSYWIRIDGVPLPPGMYHISSRWPNGGGNGTTYWATSEGGEGTDKTGCFSLDAGATWQNEGAGWNHAFEVTGICEGGCTPCPGDIDVDCKVTFNDLLILLANWGQCDGGEEGNCDDPGTCDQGFTPCQDVCFCFSVDLDNDGTIEGFCGESVSCAGLTPCPNGQPDCPAGFVCQFATCCPDGNVCIDEGTKCEGAGPRERLHPVGTFTTTGIVR